MSFENNVGKGEIARNEQFLLFPHCFLPFWRTVCHFHQIWNCRPQILSVWKSLKFVVWERVNTFNFYDLEKPPFTLYQMTKFSTYPTGNMCRQQNDGWVQHYPKCLYKVYALRIVLHSPIENECAWNINPLPYMPISLKPYDVTLCLRCCIVGLFGGNLDFNMDKIVIMREEYLKSAVLIIWSIANRYCFFFPFLFSLSYLNIFLSFPSCMFSIP